MSRQPPAVPLSGFPQPAAMRKHTPFHPFTDKLMGFPMAFPEALGSQYHSSLSNLHPILQTGSWPLMDIMHVKPHLSFCFQREKNGGKYEQVYEMRHICGSSFTNQLGARIQVDE